jgi:hypothetical protein
MKEITDVKTGQKSILTPSNKNLHHITALSDAIMFDILVPDYEFYGKDTCVYFDIEKKTDDSQYLLKKIDYGH